MPNYDFAACLSPIDFELLSKDLLEAELGIRFENFKDGKDGGIDLRHSTSKGAVIVQCKRYKSESFSTLRSKLEKEELPKIQKLAPKRYILTTSVGLSPAQADDLKLLLSPFVKSTDDIFGRDRLNSLLANHREVERRHNKLWIESAGVLETILNAGIHSVSKEELTKTIKAANLYVRNESFEEALKILSEQRVCIIAGLPGIGKTTLARMLLLYFNDHGYELVKIEEDISEATDVAYHRKPRFYYYDDFLGQTASPDKLNKNEDQRIVDFMTTVHGSKISVMILTTREYILNQAKMTYEKFDRENFDHRTCVIDLSKYSRRIRAHILYNHLHFSDLEQNFLEALVSSRSYLKIVDHKNYSPRLVEILTLKANIVSIAADDYPEFFFSNLDNPEKIWAHAFERQLSFAGQNVLRVMTTMSRDSSMANLQIAYNSFHGRRCRESGLANPPGSFKDAMRELEGTFIQLRAISNGTVVSFSNPSIRDFMQNLLLAEESLLTMIENSVFFDQVNWMYATLTDKETLLPLGLLASYRELIKAKMVLLFDERIKSELIRVDYKYSDRFSLAQPNLAERLSDIALFNYVDQNEVVRDFVFEKLSELARSIEGRTAFLTDCINAIGRMDQMELLITGAGKEVVEAVKSVSLASITGLEGYEIIQRIQEELPLMFSDSEMIEIGCEFDRFAESYYDDLMDAGIDDPEEFRDAADRFGRIGEFFSFDATETVQAIKDVADQREQEAEKDRDWDPDDERRGSRDYDHFSNNDMDSMFRTLGD